MSGLGARVLALLAATTGVVSSHAAQTPTFHEDVAPLVHASCSSCHHPGEAAPFSLLTYEDVRRRARQIRIVTRDRTMPPWLPESGHVPFRDDRSLSEEEIELLTAWIDADCPEGDPAQAAPLPEYPDGWTLGTPDVVVTMEEPYVVPAEGRDIYRNIVLRSPVGKRAWVRAVEFDPDNRAVLHHALLLVDESGGARRADDADPGVGFEAMELANGTFPDGQFVGWAPGKTPFEGTPGIAWRIDEGTDIVLQLHLKPTGKPEPIRVSLGLYFAEEEPTLQPMSVRLWSREIDIPAGDSDWEVTSSYRLPVDVDVLGVFPHAHYLGTDLRAYARRPDGEEFLLLRIPRWDFNWQEEYYYAEPLSLPAGTELTLRYTFDNSAENPLNPSVPPKRVRFGAQSEDEMAEFLLVVLPTVEERPILFDDFVRFTLESDYQWMRGQAEAAGGVGYNHQLASYCLRIGRTADAIRYYEELVEAVPSAASPRMRLGQALRAAGELERAEAVLLEALELEPGHTRATALLGLTLLELGRASQGRQRLEDVLLMDPGNLLANTGLGEFFLGRERYARARRHLDRGLETNPAHVRALALRAEAALGQGMLDRAEEDAREGLHVDPADAGAHHALALVLEARGERVRALVHARLATRFAPDEERYAASLERLQATE